MACDVVEFVRPKLDYSAYFSDDVGDEVGLTIWRLENFAPTLLAKDQYGTFAEQDAYIVLHTPVNPEGMLVSRLLLVGVLVIFFWPAHALCRPPLHINLKYFPPIIWCTESGKDWQIFFWIGRKAQLDKKASAAIHAVNLRNFLGAAESSRREEQGDESFKFMSLFDHTIHIAEGGTESGFFKVEEEVSPTRLYLLHGHFIRATAMAVNSRTLHSDHVFMIDTLKTIYFWRGRQASCKQTCMPLIIVLRCMMEQMIWSSKTELKAKQAQLYSSPSFPLVFILIRCCCAFLFPTM